MENAKNYRTFPLWVRTHRVNGAESLNFVISGVIEKFQCINDLMLMFCASSLQFKKLYSNKDVPFWILRIFSGCSFIRKENLAQVSSTCNIIENETPAQVFSCEFWEIFIQQLYEFFNVFESTYFLDHLRAVASNVQSVLDSFTILLVH